MKSIILIFLAFLMAVSSTGVAIFKHICSEDGVEISYFVQGEDPCHVDVEEDAECCQAKIPRPAELNFSDDCCNTEFNWIQLDIDLDLFSLWPIPVSQEWSEISAFFAPLSVIQTDEWIPLFSTQPPPKWKNYLAFIQVLRI